MINVASKSKGSIDRNSILSINNTRIQGSLSARNITILNKPAAQTSTQAGSRANTQTGSQANSRTNTQVHTQANSRTNTQAHTQANSHTNTQVHTQANSHTGSQAHTQAGSHTSSHVNTQTISHANTQAAPARSGTQAVSARTAQTAALPPSRKLPPLTKPVQKGQKAPLTAGGLSPGVLKACFGWNTSSPQCDADVSAFLLGADGRVIGDSWFVFYGQTKSPDNSCTFETSQAADREIITIDFNRLNTNVKKIVFVLTINEAFARRLHFGMMKDAYIRILDAHNTECVSFLMTEYYSNVISMMIGEIYQYNGSWKFNAVGNGVAKDLAGLCALYGVEVSN